MVLKPIQELQTEIKKILTKEFDNTELKRLLNKRFIEKGFTPKTITLLFEEKKFIEELAFLHDLLPNRISAPVLLRTLYGMVISAILYMSPYSSDYITTLNRGVKHPNFVTKTVFHVGKNTYTEFLNISCTKTHVIIFTVAVDIKFHTQCVPDSFLQQKLISV